MHRVLLLTILAACPHVAPEVPTTATEGAKIAAASTAWLAGDLDRAESLLAGTHGDPRAQTLLARAYAISGRTEDAKRALAGVSTTITIATDVTGVQQAVLSPDGTYVATFEDAPHSSDTLVTVWSTVTGRDLFTVEATQAKFGIDPASHETRLVAWGHRQQRTPLRAYDAATGQARWTVELGQRAYDVAIDRRGTLTALTESRATLVQLDFATGAKLRELPTDSNAAFVQVSDDSSTAVVAETVIALPKGTKLGETKGYSLLSPDGRTLAIGEPNGGVTLLERDGTPRTTIEHAGAQLQFLDDGTLLGFDTYRARRFDLTGKPLGELDLPTGLAPVGYRMFVSDRSGHLLARRGSELVVIAVANDHATIISTFGAATRATALAWSADGTKLALAGASLVQTVWTPAGATLTDLKPKHNSPLDGLAFDATGKLTGDAPDTHDLVGRRIFIRDARGVAVRYVEADEPLVAGVRAGAVLVGAGESGRVHVWNAETGQGLGELGRNSAPVTAIALRPDGKLLAIARRRGAVELWDVGARTQVLAISAGAPAAVATPDGAFDGNRRGLVRHAGEVDVPIVDRDAATVDLAATTLAAPRKPAKVTPTAPASLAPRGCLPADVDELRAGEAKLAADTLSYCLHVGEDDPYCYSANLATGSVVSTPAPIEAIAPPAQVAEWTRVEHTPAGVRLCTGPGSCRDLALKVDDGHVAVSDDGTLVAVDRQASGHVELLEAASGKRISQFDVHYGTPDMTELGAQELGFLGHSVLAIAVPCAGPCGRATIYDARGHALGELGVEASELAATRFHDDLYVLSSGVDDAFVVQDAATGKIIVDDKIAMWDVAISSSRMVRVAGQRSPGGGGAIQVYDAAVRPVARLDTPHCR